jgi:hypothetical protein
LNLIKTYLIISVGFLSTSLAFGQDLEPRLMSAVPTGGRFVIASYGHSAGNILLDNSLPLKDLESSMNNVVLAYAGSFKLFKKLAKFDVIAPFSFAQFSGVVSNVDSTTTRTGFGDGLIRLSLILVGNKPVPLSEFGKIQPKKFNLGVYTRLRVPMGQYDSSKLLNLGANRWAVKLGLVGSYAIKRKLVFELHLLSWIFGKNNDFYNGNVTTQDPLLIAQLHGSYTFKPGMWVAVSVGKSTWGTTQLNGVDQNDIQSNSRLGVAFSYRVAKHHSLKAAYTTGFSTRYGADFDTFILAYQVIWFKKQ